MTDLPRTVLPIPDRDHVGVTTYDAKDPATAFPPIEPLRPPAGAPNVLVVLIDDVGFGASSAFGGPVHMPTAERLADRGLRYTRFHTTAMCAPTRQAMLTGRNHHSVGMGSITEMATSAPGQTSVRPKSCAPLAQTLQLNGYATAQFGKCHEVPTWQTSPVGPFGAWPTQSGFDHFYGFVCAETNQYYPTLFDGTTPVSPPATPEDGYHLTDDLADRSIAWIRQQKSLTPDQPFFVYWAPGAAHAPHQVAPEWSDRYRGRFSAGWDALRDETLARQRALGVVSPECELTERSPGIPAWDDMDASLRPVLERQMEIYAGFLEHTDHHLGRVIDALEELEVLDDTLVFYIIGDNGASAEGSLQGTFNEYTVINGLQHLETPEFLMSRIDEFGTPSAYNHYAVGWAHAMNTPYQWTKQVASHWGGTRNATIVHWPNGIDAAGEIRNQFCHVIDVAPTVLDAAGLPAPDFVNGIQQRPLEGASMRPTFDRADADDVRPIQYFEMVGNRGIYYRGWTAVTQHRTPWLTGAQDLPAFDDDEWELYAPGDWSQAHDLAVEQPEMLHELQRLWLIEAVKYNVLPLDDRMFERANPQVSGRPQLITGSRQKVYGGMGRLSEASMLYLKNRSHAVSAEIVVPDDGATGVICVQGGVTGGWSLYLHEGAPTYCYNFLGLQRFFVRGTAEVPPGLRQIRMEFDYDGGGMARGADVTLYVDGDEAGSGRVDHTQPLVFSVDETFDVGLDDASSVSTDYTPQSSVFTGTVNWVELDVGDAADDEDHYLSAEERYRVALAIQ